MGRKPQIFDFTDLAILYVTAPADNASQVIEINNELISVENEEERSMDKNDVNEVVVELNAKLIESNTKVNEITNELNTAKAESNNLKNEIKAKEIELNALKTEKNELSTAVVELNKKVVESDNEKVELNKELGELKAYKDKKEEEEKKAKVNSYFDNEISRNRFTENEVNELKIFVEKNDLDGLKNAETNLIVKRHKDSLASSADLEVNSFINKTSEKKKKTLAADDFWN